MSDKTFEQLLLLRANHAMNSLHRRSLSAKTVAAPPGLQCDNDIHFDMSFTRLVIAVFLHKLCLKLVCPVVDITGIGVLRLAAGVVLV